MGHDIEAAAAMAQIRAALRAYALENDEPALVLERLAHLVDAFDVTGLVTVILFALAGESRWLYGVRSRIRLIPAPTAPTSPRIRPPGYRRSARYSLLRPL